jgi:Putative transposase
MIVPGGGLSLDGPHWVCCRPGFFLPVRVLSRLFRRLFLEKLGAAFKAGDLGFFGALAGLADPAVFARRLTELWRRECRVGEDIATLTPHSQTRMCRFPASGSSRERFAHGCVSVEDPD